VRSGIGIGEAFGQHSAQFRELAFPQLGGIYLQIRSHLPSIVHATRFDIGQPSCDRGV
jgi:hypothetical protein